MTFLTSGSGAYLEDYDLNQYGQKIQGKCSHCDYEEWFTKREVLTKQDHAINKVNLEKLESRMQAHVDRHFPHRFTPTVTAETIRYPPGSEPPF